MQKTNLKEGDKVCMADFRPCACCKSSLKWPLIVEHEIAYILSGPNSDGYDLGTRYKLKGDHSATYHADHFSTSEQEARQVNGIPPQHAQTGLCKNCGECMEDMVSVEHMVDLLEKYPEVNRTYSPGRFIRWLFEKKV